MEIMGKPTETEVLVYQIALPVHLYIIQVVEVQELVL